MLNNPEIPKHVAFIMDGNGRWAKQRGLPRTAGHREGVARVKEIIRGASMLGIETITFFTFSTENWSRPKNEVTVERTRAEKMASIYGKKLNETTGAKPQPRNIKASDIEERR